MKKLLYLLCFLPFIGYGQTYCPIVKFGDTATLDSFIATIKARQLILPSAFKTNCHNATNSIALVGGAIWTYNGTIWVQQTGGGFDSTYIYAALADTAAQLRHEIDSVAALSSTFDTTHVYAALADSVALRLKLSDTAAMLLPYARKSLVNDTANALRLLSNTKVNYTDTAAMLLNYTRYLYSTDNSLIFSPSGGHNVSGALNTAKGFSFTGVDTFTNPLRVPAIQLDVTATPTPAVGQLRWNATDETPEMQLNSNVTMQIGQENYIRCVNKTGSTIPNGRVVYIDDAQGNRPTMTLAQANTTTTSFAVGVTTESVANNAEGFVTTLGIVRDIDTRPFTTDGQALYLSADSAGVITKTIPTSPNNVVFIGHSLNTTVSGSIFIHPTPPLSADTTLSNGAAIGVTKEAIKTYLDNELADTATALRALANTKQDILTAGNGIAITTNTVSITGTGTPSSSTYYRGDYSWQPITSGATTTITAGSNITVTGTAPTYTISATGGSSTTLTAGADISLTSGTGTYTVAVTSATAATNSTIVKRDASAGITGAAINGTVVTGTSDASFNGITVGHGLANTATNTALGTSALAANTTAIQSTAVGYEALKAQTTATAGGNTAVGYQALLTITTGNSNTAFGDRTMGNTGTGQVKNTCFGQQAGNRLTGAGFNTYVGYQAGAGASNSGTENIGIGQVCLSGLTSGDYNTVVGDQMTGLTSGDNNIILSCFNNAAWGGNSLTTGGGNMLLGGYTGGVITAALANSIALSTGLGNMRIWIPSTGNVILGSTTDAANGALQVTGNLALEVAGNKINIATGTNASVGRSNAMVAGTITVSTTAVTANSIIQLTAVGGTVAGANDGAVSVGVITAGTSFTIVSTNVLDTRQVFYTIIN